MPLSLIRLFEGPEWAKIWYLIGDEERELGEWPLLSSKEFDRYLDDSVAM